MVVHLDAPSLGTLEQAPTSSHGDFDESIGLMNEDRTIDEATEITVSADECKVKVINEYVDDDSSVKVVQVDQITNHLLSDPL